MINSDAKQELQGEIMAIRPKTVNHRQHVLVKFDSTHPNCPSTAGEILIHCTAVYQPPSVSTLEIGMTGTLRGSYNAKDTTTLYWSFVVDEI